MVQFACVSILCGEKGLNLSLRLRAWLEIVVKRFGQEYGVAFHCRSGGFQGTRTAGYTRSEHLQRAASTQVRFK
eukprot:9936815-Alexandrium_andersonii.AAC.1